MRVALIHDWLTGMRGGEKVLESFCARFPDAPIHTLVHRRGSVSPLIESHPVHTSFIQRLPSAERRYQRYLPLYPAAVERFDLRGYDLVLSSSHCAAKGVIVHPGTRHLCYCHTPMRYVWAAYEEYFGDGRLSAPASWVLPPVATWLRQWDLSANVRVDSFAANSACVAARISRYYGRSARVIHPWVDTEFYTPLGEPEDFYLVASALVPYKRIELALEAVRLRPRPLVILGEGVEAERLRARAPKGVRFVGWLPSDELRGYYRRCRALLFPGEEDFGIVPVEVQACGRPVIGFGRGGLLETTRPGISGVLFTRPDAAALAEAMEESESMRWNAEASREGVLRFGRARFETEVDRWLEEDAGVAPGALQAVPAEELPEPSSVPVKRGPSLPVKHG
jgi:glycosyltransferase involved in cell wall biosynthesis